MDAKETTNVDVETTAEPVAEKPLPAAKGKNKPKAEPGPKPAVLVVENTLKCQTSEGEISLDLRIPLGAIRKLMKIEDQDDDVIMDFLLDEVIPADVVRQLENMKDGAEAIGLVMTYSEALGERLGASLGK
ncbi:hypothetical protein ACSYDW_01350 [Paeniglutamicibacter sp. R2-26]|uniref:hypothetical protein n=1 Tax=Paeniglutamicibacter sp. R2-26 TaxID=3144417 RepID=UPI003EE51CF7